MHQRAGGSIPTLFERLHRVVDVIMFGNDIPSDSQWGMMTINAITTFAMSNTLYTICGPRNVDTMARMKKDQCTTWRAQWLNGCKLRSTDEVEPNAPNYSRSNPRHSTRRPRIHKQQEWDDIQKIMVSTERYGEPRSYERADPHCQNGSY